MGPLAGVGVTAGNASSSSPAAGRSGARNSAAGAGRTGSARAVATFVSSGQPRLVAWRRSAWVGRKGSRIGSGRPSAIGASSMTVALRLGPPKDARLAGSGARP